MVISHTNESIYVGTMVKLGSGRSNFRLDTLNRNFLKVYQGKKLEPLKNFLLPFSCGWLSLTKVNLCIYRDGQMQAREGQTSDGIPWTKFFEGSSGKKDDSLKLFPLLIAVDGHQSIC